MLRIFHNCSFAREGSLVEVRNHEKWRAPALGTLGPPGDALPGSLGAKSEQAYKPQHLTHCCLCKAQDHLIKNCPLNRYYDEAPSEGLQAAQSKNRRSGTVQHCPCCSRKVCDVFGFEYWLTAAVLLSIIEKHL